MTHTVATIGIEQHLFDAFRKQLINAGHDQAIDDRQGLIDMTGIGLVVDPVGLGIGAPIASKDPQA